MTPKATPHSSPRVSPRTVTTSAYVLAGGVRLAVLVYGLLPGLLAVCLGYMATQALSTSRRLGRWRPSGFSAAAWVIVVPLVLLALVLSNAKGMVFSAGAQYEALLHHSGWHGAGNPPKVAAQPGRPPS